MLKCLFAGTSDFAVPSLQRLIDSAHEVLAVYTQPDRPAGRGRHLSASPVKQCAEHVGIPVLQPHTLNTPDAIAQMQAYAPDCLLVVAYGLLLPPTLLTVPRLGCINVHASLLPRWRGAAPIVHAILAGDTQTGVTIMAMDAGLDTGAILQQVSYSLSGQETAGELSTALAELGAATLLTTLAACEANTLKARAQDDKASSYAAKISKAQAEIDWQKPAQWIERQIRAFNPRPVAFTAAGKERLRLWQSQVVTSEHVAGKPGEVIAINADGIDVATGQGLLRIEALQRAGRKRCFVREILHGSALPVSVGMILGHAG